ncbi:MAG TPA: helix-turn-helix domain-containing protein [Blastocatellia bacterium]|nr:helix-turn-helix domain-containing protein [Blastocatellia bacterium]
MDPLQIEKAHNNAGNFGDRDLYERLETLWTISEVATILKVPKSWVYERTRKRGPDKLPFIKLGKYVRFESEAIKKFLEKQRKSALGI